MPKLASKRLSASSVGNRSKARPNPSEFRSGDWVAEPPYAVELWSLVALPVLYAALVLFVPYNESLLMVASTSMIREFAVIPLAAA